MFECFRISFTLAIQAAHLSKMPVFTSDMSKHDEQSEEVDPQHKRQTLTIELQL